MTSNDNLTPVDPNRSIHIIIDVLNDFVSGSMASLHAKEAIAKIIERINAHPFEEVLYVCDSHPENHCSFIEQGGCWAVHCVKHSFGQQIDLAFYTCVHQPVQRPRISENVFEKGTYPDCEEYSGYRATGVNGKMLSEIILPNQPILISGIATEFCVLETVKDLLKEGHQIEVLQDGLAYVTLEGHKQALAEMKELGVRLV
jgi:nicotinamidase/pyrazinamidase